MRVVVPPGASVALCVECQAVFGIRRHVNTARKDAEKHARKSKHATDVYTSILEWRAVVNRGGHWVNAT